MLGGNAESVSVPNVEVAGEVIKPDLPYELFEVFVDIVSF